MQSTQTIQAVKSLPQEMRSWLASEATSEELRKLNSELDLQDEEKLLIPHLLFRLVVKDLEPQHFAETLSDWLDISPSFTNTIVAEIKERLLSPIALQLRDWGVEIHLIKPMEITEERPIVVAPSPPPPQYQPTYEPPPPPPMGGRLGMDGVGEPSENSIVPRKKRVHIIGDAHEHTKDKNSATDYQPPVTKEAKPADNQTKPTHEDEAPFILHKETQLIPVSKEQEFGPPPKPPEPPSIPQPPKMPDGPNVQGNTVDLR